MSLIRSLSIKLAHKPLSKPLQIPRLHPNANHMQNTWENHSSKDWNDVIKFPQLNVLQTNALVLQQALHKGNFSPSLLHTSKSLCNTTPSNKVSCASLQALASATSALANSPPRSYANPPLSIKSRHTLATKPSHKVKKGWIHSRGGFTLKP